jgi:hypothetical protein
MVKPYFTESTLFSFFLYMFFYSDLEIFLFLVLWKVLKSPRSLLVFLESTVMLYQVGGKSPRALSTLSLECLVYGKCPRLKR